MIHDTQILSDRPKYIKLADIIREHIMTGKLQQGDRLLPDKQLAKKYQLNVRTVATGLNTLVKEGLLERSPRHGTVITKNVGLRTVSNAVPLIIQSNGDVYADIAKRISSQLIRRKLYPVLVDENIVYSHSQIVSFLDCVNAAPFPHGYIVEGHTAFPYEYLLAHPSASNNCVFIIKYHYPQKIQNAKYVLADLTEAGRMAAHYLIEKGHRKLTCLAMREDSFKGAWASMQVQIMEGFKAACEEAGVIFYEQIFWNMFYGIPAKEVMFDCWQGDDRPDAFFAYCDFFISSEILPVLKMLQLKYPDDIDFVGFYNTHHSQENGFTSLDINEKKLAELAVAMINGECDQQEIKVKPKLVVR